MDIPIDTFLILLGLIILSAYFSSSETALSSINKIRLKNYVDENRKGSKKALHVIENYDKALSTILVGNNIVNIAASSIATKMATELIGGASGILISTVVMTIIILVFGEVLPKSIVKENAESFSLSTSGMMLFIMKLFTPITYLFILLKKVVSKLFSNGDREPSVTEEEIKVMVDIGEEEGVLDNGEKEMIHRSLDFNDIIVAEVLTPRTDMIVIDVSQPIEEIRNIFFKERYSRIPVYEESNDNIIGILSERDFLTELVQKDESEIDVRSLLRDTIFIAESMKISKLLPELQKSKSHMAIVVDEFGGTAGLITLEDILEEIVGEIWDEHEEAVKEYTKIDDHTYEFNADIELADFAEIVHVDVPESHYYSLSGWLLETIERIPEEGEEIRYQNLVLKIDHVESRRIRSVIVTIQEEDTTEEQE